MLYKLSITQTKNRDNSNVYTDADPDGGWPSIQTRFRDAALTLSQGFPRIPGRFVSLCPFLFTPLPIAVVLFVCFFHVLPSFCFHVLWQGSQVSLPFHGLFFLSTASSFFPMCVSIPFDVPCARSHSSRVRGKRVVLVCREYLILHARRIELVESGHERFCVVGRVVLDDIGRV